MISRAILLLTLLLGAPALAEPDTTEQEVQHLINWVGASGCDFNRNGKIHSSEEAADHLRLKYKRGRRWASTTELFIDRLVTGSSLSGKPYTVDCDGEQLYSSDWLYAELARHRVERKAGNSE